MELGTEIRKGFAEDLEQEAARKIIRAIERWRKGGKVTTAQRRWLFELIQNALDVSKQQHAAYSRLWLV
jgi:DNA-directed RNA polymerase specialized sigma24 family protein